MFGRGNSFFFGLKLTSRHKDGVRYDEPEIVRPDV